MGLWARHPVPGIVIHCFGEPNNPREVQRSSRGQGVTAGDGSTARDVHFPDKLLKVGQGRTREKE